LYQVDYAHGQEGLQLGKSPELKAEVVLGVADLLELLQKADMAAEEALSGKRLEVRTATAPLRSGDAQFADCDLRIESLSELIVGSQVGQQRTLGKR
jgi:hypothetical protein